MLPIVTDNSFALKTESAIEFFTKTLSTLNFGQLYDVCMSYNNEAKNSIKYG